jgi:excisionase family DNA binding protein
MASPVPLTPPECPHCGTPTRALRRHPARAYLGIPDAATYLDVTAKTIRAMIARGELRAYRLGNRVVKIKIADLDAALKPLSQAR